MSYQLVSMSKLLPISYGLGGGPALPLFGGANRPNWISADIRSNVSVGSFNPARDRSLNLSAFSQPALFTIGNVLPRMPHVRGLAFLNEDFTESVALQLRGEFYNVMNRVSASSVDKPILHG